MMDNVLDTSNNIHVQSGLSVGATLRAAREEQGLTVADVAERIKFSVRQVEALEADDAAHLPEGTFLRGFIRSYARTLNLDESALLGSVPPAHAEPHEDVAVAQSGGEAFPTTESARRKSAYLLVGALAVALVLAGFVWSHRDSPQPEKIVIEELRLPDATAASAPIVAVPDLATASAVQVVPVKPVESVVTTVAPAKPKAVAPAPVVVPVAVPPVSGKPEVPLEQLKKRPIHIVFTDEAWMEITDVKGEVLLSRVTPAGSEKWIGGGRRAPYQVAIGKTSAVRIYYKGREVDLSQYKQAGLVHLVLE
jgi:cytoskeleton protein RodZ